jgi:hypothetical protein
MFFLSMKVQGPEQETFQQRENPENSRRAVFGLRLRAGLAPEPIHGI